MIKKIAAVSILVLTLGLTNCSTLSAGAVQVNKATIFKNSTATSFDRNSLIAMGNTKMIKTMIKDVMKYNQKTWYVFSGNTPGGWDCSGLVMWAYSQIGVDLEHSASIQKRSGQIVKIPKLGDIVAFGWKGQKGAGHVGIYIGNGKMIHAGKKGERTSIVNIKKWGKYYTKITYTRMLNTTTVL